MRARKWLSSLAVLFNLAFGLTIEDAFPRSEGMTGGGDYFLVSDISPEIEGKLTYEKIRSAGAFVCDRDDQTSYHPRIKTSVVLTYPNGIQTYASAIIIESIILGYRIAARTKPGGENPTRVVFEEFLDTNIKEHLIISRIVNNSTSVLKNFAFRLFNIPVYVSREYENIGSWNTTTVDYWDIDGRGKAEIFLVNAFAGCVFFDNRRQSRDCGSQRNEPRSLFVSHDLVGFAGGARRLDCCCGGFLRFTKSAGNINDTYAGYTYSRQRSDKHPKRPAMHTKLGIYIVFCAFVFAGGVYYLLNALRNGDRLSIEAIAFNALLGAAGIFVSMAFAGLIFSGNF